MFGIFFKVEINWHNMSMEKLYHFVIFQSTLLFVHGIKNLNSMLVRLPITPIGRSLNNTIIKGWDLRNILVTHLVFLIKNDFPVLITG